MLDIWSATPLSNKISVSCLTLICCGLLHHRLSLSSSECSAQRQVFHHKLWNQSRIASEQTLKDLKRSQGHQRGSEESVFG